MTEDKAMAFRAKVTSKVFGADERVNFTVRFPPALLDRLSVEAKRTFRTRSSIVFEAVQEYLNKSEAGK